MKSLFLVHLESKRTLRTLKCSKVILTIFSEIVCSLNKKDCTCLIILNLLLQKIDLFFTKKLKNCVIAWKGLLSSFCKDWFDVEESLWIPWKHLCPGFFFHFHYQYFIVALESYWCLLLQNLIKSAKPAKSSPFRNLLILSQKKTFFQKSSKIA